MQIQPSGLQDAKFRVPVQWHVAGVKREDSQVAPSTKPCLVPGCRGL
jgi:hypothetical protein